MSFIERVMRVMTHINIGAALGLATWLLWSSWQLATGQIAPAHRVAEVKALVSLAAANEPAPMQLVPVQAGTAGLLPCHGGEPAPRQAALDPAGADL